MSTPLNGLPDQQVDSVIQLLSKCANMDAWELPVMIRTDIRILTEASIGE